MLNDEKANNQQSTIMNTVALPLDFISIFFYTVASRFQ